MLITFEGIEACGKGEQIRRTGNYLHSKGISYFVNQEPGGMAHGLLERMLLKNPTKVALALNDSFRDLILDYPQIPFENGVVEPSEPETEILRFLISRFENTIKRVKPEIAAGKVVLSDRHLHSTKAYQGYGRYQGKREILDLIDHLHDLFIFPTAQIDKTFYLDISYEEQEKRKALAKGRDPGDIFENQVPDAFARIINGYKEMARTDSRVMLIDGMGTPEEVFSRIKPELDKLLE